MCRSDPGVHSRLKKEEHALRMRLRNNIFAQYFPELDKLQIHPGQPDDLVLSIAQHCLDPRQIATMQFEAFVKLITTRKMTLAQEKRLRWLWEVSSRSAGCEVHDLNCKSLFFQGTLFLLTERL